MDTGYDTLTPLEAYHEVMRFAAHRGEQVLRLAFHAAVPQVLRPDLLHLLRLNFVTESLDDPGAEADVLFAPFCADLGNGYFRFQRNARLQLLTQLDPAYPDEATLRSRQIAGFLLAYCDREGGGLIASNDLVYAAYLEVERWVALAFFDPDAAASQLAAAVKQSCEEGAVAARMRIGGLASALATPLARHPDLLTYAAGVEAIEAGDIARAEDLLQPLGEREIQVGGVTLRSPRSVLEERSRKRVAKTELSPQEIEPGTAAGKQGPKPSLIFISHSRVDQRWVKAIRAQLAPLEQRYGATVWSEAEIASGKQWEREVADAIDRAEVAIVLLGPAYLDSEMRMHNELSPLVERARTGALALAWTCVERCDWKATPLATIQAVHDPDEPLNTLNPWERERAMAKLAEEVAAFFRPRGDEIEAQPEAEAHPELQPRGRVLLVYRRDDAAGHVGRLRDRLRDRFGDDRVFMDIRDIPPGRDFSQVIDRALSTAAAIVVVIGPRWVDARNEDGQRQLDNPHDFLRQEVAAALSRGIPVIPVLVGEARMPFAESLPDDLVPLTRRNAIEFSDAQWDADCARLCDAIEGILQSSDAEGRSRSQREPAVRPKAGRPIARIYISSTHADLGEHRNAVYRTLTQLHHDVIGMEDYAATDMGPLQKSFDDIASCDALILIVAWRYGYIPPDPFENPEGFSVVELEYRQARKLAKPTLVFLVDEKAPWKPSLMDRSTDEGEHGKRIARFRQELARDHVVALFRTPDELATLVSKAVTSWTQTPTSISLFYSYSHRDEAFREELEAHLAYLRRGKLIAEWHDRMIGAGDEWKEQIDHSLASADIVLLLVSADFIASDYCWGEEMTEVLARHERGEARVIPVILRPCFWMRTPLGRLQAVPTDGKPVSEWSNRDAAFDDISDTIERTVDELRERRGGEHGAASTYHQLGRVAQERRDFDTAEAWYRKALEISERQGNEHDAAITYHQLGSVAEERRDFDAAEAWYRKALEIFERLGDEHGAAMVVRQQETLRSALHLRVFVASPGDVSDERALAREVLGQLPYDPLLRGKVGFEVVAWDQPGAGVPMQATMTPQTAIAAGLPKPSECDVVVVILWSRMGTPLPDEYRKPDGTPYLSGTEWEYLDALAAAEQGGKPVVLVYRRTEKCLLDGDDPEYEEKRTQYQRVKHFFAAFRNADGSIRRGCNDYAAPDDFRRQLDQHLRAIVAKRLEEQPH